MLIARLQSFGERTRWMSRLCGNPARAVGAILSARRSPEAVQQLAYQGQPVSYRRKDEQALKEVLADEEYRFIGDDLQSARAPRVLDVGAHIGTFAIWVLGRNPNARILSVEADAGTFEVLSRNAATRGNAGAAWQAVHRAAADHDDATVFVQQNDSASMSQRVGAADGLPVSTVKLATLVGRLADDGGSVDLAKIDIEGSEEAFVCGTPETLRRIRNLVIELHPSACDTDRVRRALSEVYPEITEVSGRRSSKPLLWCRQVRGAPGE